MATPLIHGPGPKTSLSPETPLPRHLKLALWALLANLLLFRRGMLPTAWMDLPYLPFIGWLDYVPSIVFSVPITMVLIISPLAILLSYRPKLFSLLIGLAILLIVVSSRSLYSTNLLFQGCLFLLIGLYRGDDRPFRWQLIILYAAAGLNKALLADWWNGLYMTNFAQTFGTDTNFLLQLVLEQKWLALLLGWATILTELILLPVFLLRPGSTKQAVLLAGTFHFGMLVLTFGQLSVTYLYLISAAYLFLLPLPESSDEVSFWQKYGYELLAALYFALLLLWLRAASVQAFFETLI